MRPVKESKCNINIFKYEVDKIVKCSGGYPYFIQFLGREAFDIVIPQHAEGKRFSKIPFDVIMRKLDSDFYAGRWSRVTDRQRDLLSVIAHIKNRSGEFGIQEISDRSQSTMANPFNPSHINQMLGKMIETGLIYKHRHGKYSFAVPLFADFVLRMAKRDSAT